MSVYGIGVAGFPQTGYYGTNRTEKKSIETDNIRQTYETVQRSQMPSGAFELHISNEQDGEAIGAACGTDYSLTIYKPKDFDPENPVYKAKIWDKEGNVTERMVDVSKVDPRNSDFIVMFAYSSYLSASGECPSAQSSFMSSSGNQHGMDDRTYKDLFMETDWISALADAMQTQYQAGNMEGYLAYKPFWDFLKS
ncbi:MAG: hypothetical protein K2M91_14140 [Lachnospiraceae bacterium]|nr:hypothetical protein [Lachnospiraceae bacterium]